MATISTNRASYQPKPKVQFGQKHLVASDAERSNLNKAINYLNTAKSAKTEAAMVANMTEAFKLVRSIVRGRLD